MSLPYVAMRRAWQDQVQRERGAGGLPVFAAALRCVPYVIPAHWADSPAALADELCSTTIHADPVIRQVRSGRWCSVHLGRLARRRSPRDE